MAASKKSHALILSLFVMPGAGHWHLGLRNIGSLIAAVSTLCFLYPLWRFTGRMRTLIETVTNDPLAPTFSFRELLERVWQSESPLIIGGMILLVVIWIGAALDIWRRGVGSAGHQT